MNVYYYLFYKLTRFLNKKGDNEWGVIFGITIFPMMNFVVIFVRLFGVDSESFEKTYKWIIGLIVIAFFLINTKLFHNSTRIDDIMSRYKNESELKRKIGNVAVLLYAALTVALIVFG